MVFKREELKRYLLKRVLFKIDYSLLSEFEVEELVRVAKEKMGHYFSKHDVKATKQADIRLDEDDISVNRLSDDLAHIFMFQDAEKDYKLIIQSKSSYLEILPHGDSKNTDYYYRIFNEFIQILKNVDLLTIHRFGLRKFNQFFLKSSSLMEVNNIFEEKFIDILYPDEFRRKNLQDAFVKEDFSYNLSREIQHGFVDKQEVYFIIFDYDAFLIDENQIKKFIDSPQEQLMQINEEIFTLFTSTLKDDFIENYLKKGVIPEYMIVE